MEGSFLSAAKPSDLGSIGVLLLVVVVGTLLELTHVQFMRGVFKSCQIFKYHLKTQVTFCRGEFKSCQIL